MKTITVRKAGAADAIDEAERGRRPAGRVRVRVKYAGVGFADVMAVRGGYPLSPRFPFSPGYEFFGRVEECPAQADGPGYLVPGTRVAGMLPRMGAYREFIDVDPRLVATVPSGLSDEKAALLPLNYLTAYAMIRRLARLEKGQSFLIHGAAGGVGSAALELARVLGLRAYGTASAAKSALVQSLEGIPLAREGNDWVEELKRLAPGGVDAAFDSYGLDSFRRSWSALSPEGTFVCYGMSPSIEGGWGDFLKGVSFVAAHTLFAGRRKTLICSAPAIVGADPVWFRDSLARILGWAEAGALQPVLAGVFPWTEMDQAHRQLACGETKGKLLLDFSR